MERFRYFEVQRPRLNIIPMIDVMMFLLVFFVLAVLHMIPDTGMRLQLPSASTATQLPHKSVLIGVGRHGRIRYQDRVMTLAELEHSLDGLQHKAQVSLVIAADSHATVAELTAVMNAARKLGIDRIGLATKVSAGDAGAGVSPAFP
jgi:biopolymer transport protein ExbD